MLCLYSSHHTHSSSVNFSSRWYLCARKSTYALHFVSQKFPQRWLWNGSNVHLIDGGPLSSFEKRSSSASSFHASLLQAIDGGMSLALCPQLMSQAPQNFRSSEKQAICEGCFACQSICSVIHLGQTWNIWKPITFISFWRVVSVLFLVNKESER